MLVYRVEHKETGLGPYRFNGQDYERKHNQVLDAMYRKHSTLDYPAWFEGDLPQSPIYLAGFDSLEKLFSWFGGFTTKLTKLGYLIKIYSVNKRSVKVGYSKKQVNFVKTNLRQPKILSFTEARKALKS